VLFSLSYPLLLKFLLKSFVFLFKLLPLVLHSLVTMIKNILIKLPSLLTLLMFATSVFSQKHVEVQIITSGINTSIRGMSVPSETVVWVSGSNGTVGKSVDGGGTWRWITVPGYESRDFRDIEAFDSSTAIVMSVDNPAYILKTIDGGKTWKKVFEKNMNGMFLDAMDFKNDKEGICIGDPIMIGDEGRKFYYLIRTYDGGDTWSEVPAYQLPRAEDGAAIFSASGTNISFLNHPDFEYAFITGGLSSHIILMGRPGKPSKAVYLPILQRKASAGAFSMATDKQKRYYVIGGDYKVPRDYFDNFYFTTDAGNKWRSPSIGPPFGYRSCIRLIKDKMMIACGPTGVDFAENGEKEWEKASLESFNVCMVSKGGQVFLAGEKGKIGRLVY
jgi:photosystem II stability/assembly factor-like uncharacterized protein